MLVATITLRVSLAVLQNTLSCSAFGSDPYIGNGSSFSRNNIKILNVLKLSPLPLLILIWNKPLASFQVLYRLYEQGWETLK